MKRGGFHQAAAAVHVQVHRVDVRALELLVQGEGVLLVDGKGYLHCGGDGGEGSVLKVTPQTGSALNLVFVEYPAFCPTRATPVQHHI